MKKESSSTHRPAMAAVAEAAAQGFAEHSERGLLESQLREQKKLYDRGEFAPFWLAQTANRLGRKQEALQYLQASALTHDEAFLMLEEDPTFHNLRGDRTFEELLARVSLTPGT